MQSATERRQRILEDLSEKRFITRESLAGKFGVSVRTISRDIELLSCSAPLYTTQGKGGCIRAADGWYLSRKYLREEQETLLRSLAVGLQPEDQKIMQDILAAFAKPHLYKEAHP